ncbi:MAG: hypothetical protein JWM81_1186 [Candidatus Saccharibacteria bacterium]|nr:hypothetical protein [Candidatus Saccharibacteria bacterium]
MPTPEYVDREMIARGTFDMSGIFPGQGAAEIIRSAGNAALYSDFALTPGANPNKHDGPRSAVYSVADFTNGVLLSAARLHARTDGSGLPESDEQFIAESVERAALGQPLLDKPTFALAHNITALVAFPGTTRTLLGPGVELRVSPDNTRYAALIIPTYFRKAPQAIARYVKKMKLAGNTDIDPRLADLAYTNDGRKVARFLALNAVSHILATYAQEDDLEAEFKDD